MADYSEYIYFAAPTVHVGATASVSSDVSLTTDCWGHSKHNNPCTHQELNTRTRPWCGSKLFCTWKLSWLLLCSTLTLYVTLFSSGYYYRYFDWAIVTWAVWSLKTLVIPLCPSLTPPPPQIDLILLNLGAKKFTCASKNIYRVHCLHFPP